MNKPKQKYPDMHELDYSNICLMNKKILNIKRVSKERWTIDFWFEGLATLIRFSVE
jgi:hypothetical protein